MIFYHIVLDTQCHYMFLSQTIKKQYKCLAVFLLYFCCIILPSQTERTVRKRTASEQRTEQLPA